MKIWHILAVHTLPGQAFQVIRPRQFESLVTAESGFSSYPPGGENHGPVGFGLNLVTQGLHAGGGCRFPRVLGSAG